MDNAKLITYILFVLAIISVARHKHTPSQPTASISTPVFFTTQGLSQRVAERTVRQKPVAQALTYTVTATAYQAVTGQTDDEPFVTADNSRIKPHYSSRTRWLALSQDLLARWDGDFQYGDQVVVSGISPQLDGTYTVHDTMNKRHHHCMDILTHTREKIDICAKNVKIRLAAATASRDSSSYVSQARATSLARLQSKATEASNSDLFLATNGAKRPDYFASAML
jgi:3D (Asp-Asp-Asp) domain-containing protein